VEISKAWPTHGAVRTRRLARVWVLGVALAFTAGAAEAQVPPPAKWDQARVTDIALKLRDATKDLYVEALKSPDKPVGSSRRAQYSAREDLRQINNMARRLASQLKAGKGRDETHGIYERLQMKRRDAEEEGRKIDIGQSVLEKIGPVNDLLRQLSPYYDEAAAAQ
jgi:hypothetical protein